MINNKNELLSEENLFKVNGDFFSGNNSSIFIFPPFSIYINSKRSKAYPLRVATVLEGFFLPMRQNLFYF